MKKSFLSERKTSRVSFFHIHHICYQSFMWFSFLSHTFSHVFLVNLLTQTKRFSWRLSCAQFPFVYQYHMNKSPTGVYGWIGIYKKWVPLFSHRVLFCLYFRFWRKTIFTTGRKENRIIWKVLQITFSQTLVHLRSRSWNSWLQKCFTKK